METTHITTRIEHGWTGKLVRVDNIDEKTAKATYFMKHKRGKTKYTTIEVSKEVLRANLQL